MQIIDGRALAEKIKDEVVKEIAGGRKGDALLNCPRPNLAIILVGEREDSKLYVGLKQKEAQKVGIDTHLYRLEENISEQELLDTINYLNNDELIDAILVQLPLPEAIDTDKIIGAIRPDKDVDGFHPANLKIINDACDHGHILPPVFDAVLEMLKSIKYELAGEQVCIIANSDIFGKSLAKVLECRGAITAVVRPDDGKMANMAKIADLLITAAGKPKLINGNMIKKGAVLIDIGISKEGGKVVGDVDFGDVDDMASFVSPVPGGVGPLTIACAFRNVVALYRRRCKK